ncbi:hypothetical protein BX600DRAFT_453965 [Xylariales sp. PMI_506]|nr:hypothetical protein BX600DRAFT_453965 [Xylariales sp. PMI_506]
MFFFPLALFFLLLTVGKMARAYFIPSPRPLNDPSNSSMSPSQSESLLFGSSSIQVISPTIVSNVVSFLTV